MDVGIDNGPSTDRKAPPGFGKAKAAPPGFGKPSAASASSGTSTPPLAAGGGDAVAAGGGDPKVERFLEAAGLMQYISIFTENDIEFDQLLELEKEDLVRCSFCG
jgi:hypothetical protein